MEEWKTVRDHPSYKISSGGRLWSSRSNKFITTKNGIVNLDGEVIWFAQLMGVHFFEDYDQSKMIYRKNKDINEYSIDNLYMDDAWSYNKTDEAKERIKDGWAKKNGMVIGKKGDLRISARSSREMESLTGIPKSTINYCINNGRPTRNGWIFLRIKE